MHMVITGTIITNIRVTNSIQYTLRAYWALFIKSTKSRNYNQIVEIDCLNLEKSVSVGWSKTEILN